MMLIVELYAFLVERDFDFDKSAKQYSSAGQYGEES